MRKKLFYSALWGVFTIFLLFACRTEDNLSQQNNETKQRFAIFIPQSPNEKVDYANGFAYLYQNYYNVNNVGKSQQKAVIDQFGVVDFRIHSQLLTYKDGSKAMIFPIRQMGITKGLVMGILENEETNLRYVRLEENYEGYSGIIQNFAQNDKKFKMSDIAVAAMKKNKDVREEPDRPTIDEGGGSNIKTIPEVIIIVPVTLPTVPPIIPNAPGGVPVIPSGGGGCQTYGGCNLPPPSSRPAPPSKSKKDSAIVDWTTNHIDYSGIKDNKCINDVYQKLKAKSELFNNLLDKFDGKSILDLKLVITDMGENNKVAVTELKNVNKGYVTIHFNPNYMGSTEFARASTIIHEMLHAYMTWQLLNSGWNGIDNAESYQKIDEKNLPTLLKAYKDRNYDAGASEHDFMANYYIPKIVNALKAYDPNLGTDSEYNALAWLGLQGTSLYLELKKTDPDREATIDALLRDNVKTEKCKN